jgi:hypothetical protein
MSKNSLKKKKEYNIKLKRQLKKLAKQRKINEEIAEKILSKRQLA